MSVNNPASIGASRTAYARNADIATYNSKARRGEIPQVAVVPLATVLAALRKAQCAIGPGHFPLDAILDSLPPLYVENCLRKRRNDARRLAA